MKKVLGLSLLLLGLGMATLFTGSSQKADATAIVGTAGVGDECNVHASDASHTCSAGLVCVPTNDHSEGNGKCQSTVTPTPTHGVTPTPTHGVTPTPTQGVTPTPTSGVTPTDTPAVTVTPNPTTPPSPHGDGLSDGRSSCPECTQAPHNTQAVLGAETMAATGAFDTQVMNFVLLGGMLSMGAAAYAKAKKA